MAAAQARSCASCAPPAGAWALDLEPGPRVVQGLDRSTYYGLFPMKVPQTQDSGPERHAQTGDQSFKRAAQVPARAHHRP
jgi:hypothetical protein